LIEITFEIKKFLKKKHTSNYLINRRVIDSGSNNRQALQEKYAHELKRHHHHLKTYKPLGQMMLETHLINEEQLNEALNHHWNTGQRIGEAVVSLGFFDEDHLKQLLEHQ